MITQLGGTFSVEEFLQFMVPVLVKGQERLRILFSTYNEVTGYDDGPVETKDPSLRILVATGGVRPDSLGFLFSWLVIGATGNFKAFGEIAEGGNERAREGQAVANEKLAEQASQNGYPDIAVIYAGFSAFSSAIEAVRELHKQSPETFTAVLTCTCDLRAKERELDRAEGVGAVIVTPYCGGRAQMRDILNAFIAQWPNRKQEAA